MSFRFFPGDSSGPRQYGGYSARQEANWVILNDAYYSSAYGYGHTRMAFPGARIEDPERYAAWKIKFFKAWQQESSRTAGTRGLDSQDISEAHLRHIYLRMMEVEKAYPKAPLKFWSGGFLATGQVVSAQFLNQDVIADPRYLR